MTIKGLTRKATHIFRGIEVDFYQDEKGDYLFTREQVGTSLGYTDPVQAIRQIHDRHSDRFLDKATRYKVYQVEGNRTVCRDVWVYNYKGVYEICRHSRQRTADEFMDWVWDRLEELRKNGVTSLASATAIVPEEIKPSVWLAKLAEWMKSQEQENFERDRLITENSERLEETEQVVGDLKNSLSKTLRCQLVSIVKEIAAKTGMNPGRLFNIVFKIVGKWHGINIKETAREWGCKPIDVLERLEFLADGIKAARYVGGY